MKTVCANIRIPSRAPVFDAEYGVSRVRGLAVCSFARMPFCATIFAFLQTTTGLGQHPIPSGGCHDDARS